MDKVFYGNILLPYMEGDKLEFDTDWVTPALGSVREVNQWLSKHPDLDKTTPLISSYRTTKEGPKESISDYYRDGSLVPMSEYMGTWEIMWKKTAHLMCSVHPRILAKHDCKEDPEFFQQIMPEGLKKEQGAYCNGCGNAYRLQVEHDAPPRDCECGSLYLTYTEMLEQVNWF